MGEINDERRNDTKMATIYELRLMIAKNNKEQYTKEEVLELLDAMAMAKDQK